MDLKTNSEVPTATAVAPWYGSNRILAAAVGEELAGARWVGIPFAGGMSELVHITAPTILVNDLHRHVINLARVMADGNYGPTLIRRLRRLPFHPDTLRMAQLWCRRDRDVSRLMYGPVGDEHLTAAEAYFTASWMGRSGKAGIDDEFNGRLSTRWNANGGDSNTRYRSAVSSIQAWRRILQRCSFSVLDAFEFLDRCEDSAGHAIYCDPPFPGPGDRYLHCFSEENHRQLAVWLAKLRNTRVVCRFYDHPLIREIYPEGEQWTWRRLVGRKQSNAEASELLILNGPSHADAKGLF